MTATKTVRAIAPKTADVKYTGNEPEWTAQPTADRRNGALISAFAWYNYHCSTREARDIMVDWLQRQERLDDSRGFARVPDSAVNATLAWLVRCNLRGLELTQDETDRINTYVSHSVHATQQVQRVVEQAETRVRPNIQDRLREKMLDTGGELEGMYDEFVTGNGRLGGDFRPITVLRTMNVAPQLVGELLPIWQARREELEAVLAGKDVDLVEGYSNYGRAQIKNMIKFCEQVLADCGSYVQIKKVERKPRKKKPVSREKQTARFRYLRQDTDLAITSEPVTKLVDATEAWLYDVKKRKLIYVVADSHVGSFTVKGTALVGFDVTNSVAKTLRRPAEQLAAITTGGIAQARNNFRAIKAVETRFNGRGNENIIILRVK